MNLVSVGMVLALGLSALGSCLGSGAAGMSAVGAWKKCYLNAKPDPIILVAFAGAPLTQTIYGFLLVTFIKSNIGDDPAKSLLGFRIHDEKVQKKMFEALELTEKDIKEKFGFFVEALKYGTPPHGGLAIGMSAFFQGKVAASAANALGETGKGTGKYFIVVGIVETVALFTLIFSLLLMQ